MKTHSCLECQKEFVCEFGFCAESHSDSICKSCFDRLMDKMMETDSRTYAIPNSWKLQAKIDYRHENGFKRNRISR